MGEESIECFLEDHGFRIIRLLSPPLHHLFCQQDVSLSQSSCVSPVELTDGRVGGRVDEELNHTTARKP